jgi:hypothetical protein
MRRASSVRFEPRSEKKETTSIEKISVFAPVKSTFTPWNLNMTVGKFAQAR